MQILNQPIKNFSFDAVVDFCQESIPEGTQIDYKKDFSRDGLAKDIVAFANTRGGVILLGIKEDSQTGLPEKWEGLEPGKHEDRVHAYARNIDPLPLYEVHTTDEKDGKVFVLVRVFEGDETPYFVQNDSQVYTRVGNLTDGLKGGLSRPAKPEELSSLFNKGEKAQIARQSNLQIATKIHAGYVQRFHQISLDNFKKPGETYNQPPLYEDGKLIFSLQPHFPNRAIGDYESLSNLLQRANSETDFHFQIDDLEGVPSGVMSASKFRSTDFTFLNSSGLLYFVTPIRAIPAGLNGPAHIFTSWIVEELYHFLWLSRFVFSEMGYCGRLIGQCQLAGMKAYKVPFLKDSWQMSRNPEPFLIDEYYWPLSIATSAFFEDDLKRYFIQITTTICQELGQDISTQETESLISDHLKRFWSKPAR